MRRIFIVTSFAAVAATAWFHSTAGWAFLIVGPLVLLGVYDMFQKSNTIFRNFPVLGHFRYFFEMISPEIQQYFIERHTDGTPISRNHRVLVYERARDKDPTHPFGTELDIYKLEYEALTHSMYPVEPPDDPPRVKIGGSLCAKPYSASVLNISAMSFGAISKNAILAMNQGARMGGFYHNTGEGGLSDYHLEGGGDVVWQIGTGYFGCRTEEGRFDPEAFQEKASHEHVKMIELKISQGAKPGHGGVLPAEKNNEEIAKIRQIEPHTVVLSPPGHAEFSDSMGLLEFIKTLRRLSGGKPVGFKLCIGKKSEFTAVCEAMTTTGTRPDFITVDGAEGGTGGAPLEYSDSVGMPLEPALRFVDAELRTHGLRNEIRVIASGKVLTAFSLVKMFSYGADLCNSARAFMLAVGCIQALRCHTNKCPTGVATQDPKLVKGLVVDDKKHRVANFHRRTVKAALHLAAACGVKHLADVTPDLLIHGTDWKRTGGVMGKSVSPSPLPVSHGGVGPRRGAGRAH